MIHRLSRQTLVNIGLAGAMGVFGMSYMARGKIYEVTMQSDTYRTALKTLKSHPGAQHILGQPIIDKGIFRNIEKNNHAATHIFLTVGTSSTSLHIPLAIVSLLTSHS